MEKKISIRAAIAAGIIVFVLVADQIIKWAVKTQMCLYEKICITDWFHIFFTENDGMAFGMDFIGTAFLATFRVIAVAFFSYLLFRLVRTLRYPIGLIVCVALVVAGAAGNIIDNCLYGLIFSESLPFGEPSVLVPFGEGYGSFLSGRVVDMFYFPLFTWPDWMPVLGGNIFFGAVFNFADACISCGAVAILLFYRKFLTETPAKDNEEVTTE